MLLASNTRGEGGRLGDCQNEAAIHIYNELSSATSQ